MPDLHEGSAAPELRRSATTFLLRAQEGDREAQRHLCTLLYEELRKHAAASLRRERAGHTLQPTALVHDVWMRLMRSESAPPTSRESFLALAAKSMRNVLVDYARARNRDKRGGGRAPEELGTSGPPAEGGEVDPLDVLALEEALQLLAGKSPRLAEVVELHFYGGLTFEEIASVLRVGIATAKRDWRAARAFLSSQLGRS